jgi:hypothetical protein
VLQQLLLHYLLLLLLLYRPAQWRCHLLLQLYRLGQHQQQCRLLL